MHRAYRQRPVPRTFRPPWRRLSEEHTLTGCSDHQGYQKARPDSKWTVTWKICFCRGLDRPLCQTLTPRSCLPRYWRCRCHSSGICSCNRLRLKEKKQSHPRLTPLQAWVSVSAIPGLLPGDIRVSRTGTSCPGEEIQVSTWTRILAPSSTRHALDLLSYAGSVPSTVMSGSGYLSYRVAVAFKACKALST